MQGISGTGKTSLACVFGDFIENKSTVVSVQPFWKESSDLLGYFNEFTKKYSETEFLQVLQLSPSNLEAMDELVKIYKEKGDAVKVEKYEKKMEVVKANMELDKKEAEAMATA